MKIINETKKIVLAENANLADTPFKRIKGLLGRKSLGKGEALIIKPCNSIHTFFMSFPIDVIFVDKKDKIVKTIFGLQPFRLGPIILKSAYVIELSAGIISPESAAVADTILFGDGSPQD